MKAGDLVTWRTSNWSPRNPNVVGVVVNPEPIRNRIGILWSNRIQKIEYEPITMMEVVSESR